MRTALIVAAWILAPVAAILIMTTRWLEIGTLATLACLALVTAPAVIASVTSARRNGATGIGAAVVFVATVGCVFAAMYFLGRYWGFYHLSSTLHGVLMAFVVLPAMLALTAGVGALIEARARRRGLDELRAAGVATGAVALAVGCLVAVVVIASAPRRNAWEHPNPRAFGTFAARIVGLGPHEEPECSEDSILRETCVLQLAYGAGDLRLPPGSRLGPLGTNDDGSHIVLGDSTVVDVWVTRKAPVGLATPNGAAVDSVWHADTTIAALPATLSTVKLSWPSGSPEYLGQGLITVDSMTVINFIVMTATPTSRDDALRFIARSIAPAGS
jgi:hypothetical protein